MYVFLHSSLSARFDFSRVRIAFSGLLAFTWGFSNWFYSGLKKRSWKKIEHFWSKIDFKIEIEKFSKIFKNFEKINIFDFFFFFEKFQLKSNFFRFSIFRKIFEKMKNRKNLDFFEIFEKFSISILKSIFDQKFSIFFHDFFKPL